MSMSTSRIREASFKIHDQNQFEFKIDYPIDRESKITKYRIETYLFVPYHLNINRATYSKKNFYRDIHGFIRFKTPEFLLEHLIRSPDSPYQNLLSLLNSRMSSLPELEYAIKMFVCVFKSSLREHFAVLRRSDSASRESLIRCFIEQGKLVSCSFRKMFSERDVRLEIESELEQCFFYADEYMSFLLEDYGYRIIRWIDRLDDCISALPREELLSFIRCELEYRKHKGYPSVPRVGGSNEMVLFRKSVLKKYISNILFLKIRPGYESEALREIFFAIAAGLSMFFATVVAFFFQSKYGNLTLPFLMALVVGYMFKDRVKDLMRSIISHKILVKLDDYRVKIYDPQTKKKIGLNCENFQWRKKAQVDKNILNYRNMDHITEINNESYAEKILYYHKKVNLLNHCFDLNRYGITGLTDIMRFNIMPFLKYMDDPDQKVYALTAEGYQAIRGSRVYHINAIIRFTSHKRQWIQRFRIVLHRRGIKRIEALD